MSKKPEIVLDVPRTTNRSWTLVVGPAMVPIGLTKLFGDRDKFPGKNLCREHQTPLKQAWFCEKGEHYVTNGDVAHAFEYDKEQYVVMSEADLAALPADHDGIIELTANVPKSHLDSDIFEGVYLAIPQKTRIGLKNYSAITAYLLKHNRAFMGTGVWWGSTKTFVVEAKANGNGILVVRTCNYYDNLRTQAVEQLSNLPLPAVDEQDMKVAETIFGSLPQRLNWTEVRDEAAERQRAVVMEKVRTGQVTPSEPTPAIEDVPDIFEALRAEMQEQARGLEELTPA